MARVILVRKVEKGWVVGREGHDFQRFASKASALERARALIAHLGDAELVIEESTGGGSPRPKRLEKGAIEIEGASRKASS